MPLMTHVAASTRLSGVDYEKVSFIRTINIFSKIGSPLPTDTDEDTQSITARSQCETSENFPRNLTVTAQRQI
jgi:hypothetical protein